MEKNSTKYFFEGKSTKIKSMSKIIRQVAPLFANILLYGEAGTGKNTVAKYIHHKSKRSGEVNFLNPAKFYKKDKVGDSIDKKIRNLFIKSSNGTIIINDIADFNKVLQSTLHNMVKYAEETNVRVIACTSKDLKELVRQKRFSSTLYHLFPANITVPPLRDRKEDIPSLADIFLTDLKATNNLEKVISTELLDVLVAHNYPGNVRELESLITNLYIKSDVQDRLLLPSHLSEDFGMTHSKVSNRLSDDLYRLAKNMLKSGELTSKIDVYQEYKEIVEIPLIKAALDITNRNKSVAANLLNINRNTLAKLLKEYNID